MKSRHEPSKAACPNDGFIHARIDPAFIDTGRETAKDLSDPADRANQSVPKKTIKPAGDERGGFGQRDDGVGVKFVDPHFVVEKTEDRGLRPLERIGLAGAPVDHNSETDS